MRIARKVFHVSGVVVVILYEITGIERPVFAAGLWGVVALLLLLDVARSRIPVLQRLFRRTLRPILERKDVRGINTSTLYFTGCALTVSLFARPEACAGVLALVAGDPAAAVVGTSVRSPRYGKVSLAGSLACLAAATVVCRIYAPWPHALLAGAAAMVLEAVSGAKLDNLTIPVGAALVLHLL